MQKKSLVEIVLSIIVGLLFLSSYAAIGQINGGGGRATTSTTTVIPQTYYASGLANASIHGYAPNVYVNVSCANRTNAVMNYVDNIVTGLQNNNSVFYSSEETGSVIQVQAGSMNSTAFYSYVKSMLNASSIACTSFQGSALVSLPSRVSLTTQGQSVPVQLNSTQLYAVPLSLAYGSNTLRVKIMALLETNGTVYQNLTVSSGA